MEKLSNTPTPSAPVAKGLPAGIWALGFVSMLMDISSEMVHSLLPLFMVSSLGASAFIVGLVEGAAEATALIVKVFSGVLSDYVGRRKPLAVAGYAELGAGLFGSMSGGVLRQRGGRRTSSEACPRWASTFGAGGATPEALQARQSKQDKG